MRAMVLAAGLGSRLRPLTNDRPKALVELGGRTLLEITLARLREFGIGEVIVNAHHFADMIVDYLKAHDHFGLRIEVSREDVLLDTGGGLKKAAWFFLENPGGPAPFLVHNVDVISTIDLGKMAQLHAERGALATLAMQSRKTSRYLLFDEEGELSGHKSANHPNELVRSTDSPQALAFCGLHVISPQIFSLLTEPGPFSIVDTYLRLAAGGEKILAFRADEYYWRDLGRPGDLLQTAEDMRQNVTRQA